MNFGETQPKSFDKQHPIPGYVTRELLGSGGYGEVWKANAPGGLVKAVKFVYGDINSKRANRELRSLNRIKEVRHPFLLSVERIEIVQGNLVIVTELADSNLNQVFEKCQEKGLQGIPRTELLSYLADAADALDYIYHEYALQHLDIKPENLLLVGNRVKVADYGLIKSLYDRSASLVEGLTPYYAPPEVFDGQPNKHSDQYSLAIVYYEMLTGELPFNGKSTARLAAQHLHDPPNLDRLPNGDELLLARALSKQPDQRFGSCREFIESLMNVGKSGPIDIQTHLEASGSMNPPDSCMIADRIERTIQFTNKLADAESVTDADSNGMPLNDSASANDRLSHNGDQVAYSPTIFVGVGGTAARVLTKLKSRFHFRIGHNGKLPVLPMLLIDTDVGALNNHLKGKDGFALDDDEILGIQLRNADEYSSHAKHFLQWISRRWLYNIPRDLKTNGFRPLGRLAWVDNSRRISKKIQELISSAVCHESLDQFRDETGLNFVTSHPRVVLVGSLSGGTGSGMVLDLAYQIRTILSENGLMNATVDGILLHSTSREAKERDKATANTYAALRELSHFSRPGNCYPGDQHVGVPAFHGNNMTFGSAYLVHLGENLNETEWTSAADPIAEYLYCDSVTPVNRLLNKCRRAQFNFVRESKCEPVVRTFCVSQLGGSSSRAPLAFTETLCRELTMIWRSGDAFERGMATVSLTDPATILRACDDSHQIAKMVDGLNEKTAELGLGMDELESATQDILLQEIGTDPDTYLGKIIEESLGNSKSIEPSQVVRAMETIDSIVGLDDRQDAASPVAFEPLIQVLETRLKSRAAQVANQIREWIFHVADGADARTEGAKHAAEWFQNYLREIASAAHERGELCDKKATQYSESIVAMVTDYHTNSRLSTRSSKRRSELCRLTLEYGKARLDQVVIGAVRRYSKIIEDRTTAVTDKLREFWKDLNLLSNQFAEPAAASDPSNAPGGIPQSDEHWQLLQDRVMQLVPDLVQQLEESLAAKHFGSQGVLCYMLSSDIELDGHLATEMREVASSLIFDAMQKINLEILGIEDRSSSCEYVQLKASLESSIPRVFRSNKQKRLFVTVPKSDEQSSIKKTLRDHFDESIIVVEIPKGDVVAFYEIEQHPIAEVANQLIRSNPTFAKAAAQLHTRTDIQWHPFKSDNSTTTFLSKS